MKKHLFFLFTIVVFIFMTSCISEESNTGLDIPSINPVETVTLSFSVELESEEDSTRAPGDPGFGNGNKINNLVYALYTQDSSSDPDVEGEIKPVKFKDENGNEQHLVRVPFNPMENEVIKIQNVEIIKGIEYTLMLWAQYRPDEDSDDENDRIFYELGDNGIIRIKSYPGFHFPNNDDRSDVFSAVYKIVQYEDDRNLKLILRRPFAQINIGVKESLLKRLKRGELVDQNGNLLIEKSSITISGDIANKYNLFKNIAEIDKDEEGETTGHTRTFAPSVIPSKAEDYSYQKLIVKDPDTNESEEYVWLSMCYILPNGELGNISKIDIPSFKIYDENEEEIKLLSTTSFTDVPVLRNRRTNIILSYKDFDFSPWQEQTYVFLKPEEYTSLIDAFKSQSVSDYNDQSYLTEFVDEPYKESIITDYEDNKYVMLDAITYTNQYNILPIHRNYTLYGKGEETVIIKDSNGNYHNIGPVRNLVIQDQKGNNKIFIDEEGYVWTYNNNEKKKTENYLSPLTGDNKSYNVTCNTGEVKLSNYYH